jgi:hypothetical protein
MRLPGSNAWKRARFFECARAASEFFWEFSVFFVR